jgi:hypothetical protein
MTVASEDAGNPAYVRSLAAAAQPPDSARAAVRLSAALRQLVDTATGSDAPDELLDQVAAEVERLVPLLSPIPRRAGIPRASVWAAPRAS